MALWTEQRTQLKTLILEKEKGCTSPIMLWTDQPFICRTSPDGKLCPPTLCGTGYPGSNHSEYEEKIIMLKLAVLARSEDVAKAMCTLIRYDIEDWSAIHITSDICTRLPQHQRKNVTTEAMFEQLINQVSLERHEFGPTISMTYDCFAIIDPKDSAVIADMCRQYKSVSVNQENDKLEVGVTIERSLNDIQLFTPSEMCLDWLLDL